jgi:hypothetical protein
MPLHIDPEIHELVGALASEGSMAPMESFKGLYLFQEWIDDAQLRMAGKFQITEQGELELTGGASGWAGLATPILVHDIPALEILGPAGIFVGGVVLVSQDQVLMAAQGKAVPFSQWYETLVLLVSPPLLSPLFHSIADAQV